MIIVYRDRDKFKNFTIIGKRKNGGGDVEPKPLLKSKIYIGTDGRTNDDIQITIPKEVGSFYGSVGNDYENSTFYPNEEGTVITTTASQGYNLYNVSKNNRDNKSISFNRDVQVEMDLFTDVDDYAFCRLFANSKVSNVFITSYCDYIGRGAFQETFYISSVGNVYIDIENSKLGENCFSSSFYLCRKLTSVNLGKVNITTESEHTFDGTFMASYNLYDCNVEFILPYSEFYGGYYIPSFCFSNTFVNTSLATTNVKDIFKSTPPNVVGRNGMYSMFYGANITETPLIPNLKEVGEYGMFQCFYNTFKLNKIHIDFRLLQVVYSNGLGGMFSNSESLLVENDLYFELWEGDTMSNIIMNIGNNETVLSEFACFEMFKNSTITSGNLLYVNYDYSIPEGCFESMFENVRNLSNIGIGSMEFEYNIRHPLIKLCYSADDLTTVYCKLDNYTDLTYTNWLGEIHTNGTIYVSPDANLGQTEEWLPYIWNTDYL